jgi:hypothetical protein
MPPVVAVVAAYVAFAVQSVAFAGAYWIAYYATQAAIYYGINRALTPKVSLASIRELGTEVNVRDPAAPRQIIYGRRRVSGVMYPAGTSGSKNEYLHILLLVSAHEVEELGDIYFNDDLVSLDGSGNGTGKWSGYVRIKKHLGTYNQAADSFLTSEVTGWTAAHKLGGIAYLYIRLKYSPDLFSGVPEFYVVTKGRKVWDPRAGAQSSTDPTTWTYSANAALCLLDWVRGVPTRNSAGTMVRNFGLRAPDAEIDTASANEAANICDEPVVLDDLTTESRYTANGLLTTRVVAADGIEALKSAMAGECVFIGGQWVIRAGAYRTPTVTLTDSDLRAALVGVQFKPSRRELCNGVKGIYISEQNIWQPSDFPAVTNATYKTQDGEERLWHDIELPLTTSPACAQRLAKVILERSRQPITFTAKCKLTAMQIQPTDVIQVTHSRFGWTNKTFEVLSFSFAIDSQGDSGPYLGVDLVLRETAAAVWTWANGEETTVDLAPNTDLPDPFSVPTPAGLTLSSDSFRQLDGTYIPVLKAVWTAAGNQYVEQGGKVRVEYKLHAATDWIVWSEQRGDAVVDYITAVQVGSIYDVRVQFESGAGVRSNNGGTTTLNDYATVSSYTVTNDTTPPAARTDLAAVAGTGKVISLSWSANTETDFDEYRIYRNTANNFAAATKIAEVASSRFVDCDLSLATLYYYWVTAVDRSNNASSQSNVASATTSTIAASSTDSTPPGTPAAFLMSSTQPGAYLSDDGTVFTRLNVSLPAMPTLGVVLNLLYKLQSGTNYLIAGQYTVGSIDAIIDDLTPGEYYTIAVQAFSAFGIASAVTIVTGTNALAPVNTTASANPTAFLGYSPTTKNIAGSTNGGTPPLFLHGMTLEWTASTSRDVAFIEIGYTFVSSSTTIPPSTWRYKIPSGTTSAAIYGVGFTGYIWVRTTNFSGVVSTPVYTGINFFTYGEVPIVLGTIAAQSAAAVVVTGITQGAGTLQRQVVARQPVYKQINLIGGAASETYSLNITNWGFSAAPDVGWFQSADQGGMLIRYDYDSSSSTVAELRITMADNSNIPAWTNMEITGELAEYT